VYSHNSSTCFCTQQLYLSEHGVSPAALEEVHVSLHHVARNADDKAGAAHLAQVFGGSGAVHYGHLVVYLEGFIVVYIWRVLLLYTFGGFCCYLCIYLEGLILTH
jgi:hypothetical protein